MSCGLIPIPKERELRLSSEVPRDVYGQYLTVPLIKYRNHLYQRYIIDKVPMRVIGEEYSCTVEYIRQQLKRFGIKKDFRVNHQYPNFILVGGCKKKYPCYDKDVFEVINSEEKAYWLGFLMADGCVSGTGLRLCLGKKDKKHLLKFKKFMRIGRPIYEVPTYVSIAVFERKIVDDIKRYGIIPKKAGKERIKNIPVRYYKDFIRGLIDGDGHIGIQNTNGKPYLIFNLASASVKLLQQVQKIFFDVTKVKPTKIQKPFKAQHTLLMTYGGKSAITILKWLYVGSTIHLERKAARLGKFFDIRQNMA